jgi:DNA-binding transcriptional ArsR family regulator
MSPQRLSEEQLKAFHEAVQSLKLYRRAELENDRGDSLIEELYVDPLPNEHVLETLLKPNTTFIIGRKGTGKSTVFLRAQRGLLKTRNVLSTYIDIKTVFESAQVDSATVEAIRQRDEALPATHVHRLLLMRSFLRAVVAGIRGDIAEQLKTSWRARAKDAWTGSSTELFAALDEFIEEIDSADFVDIQGLKSATITHTDGAEFQTAVTGTAELALQTNPGIKIGGGTSTSAAETATRTSEFSAILLRTIDVKALITRLREVLAPLGVKHLVIFVDDFSELPLPAMQSVVDVLLAPLNNWSEELVKFKVAAYPGRIYYGAIDKSKIDEVSLDMHSLYGQANVAEMELKAIDFTRRLVERRFNFFGFPIDGFLERRSLEQLWRTLFFASLGNPRTLGYVLFYLYESQLIYDRLVNVRSVRDAAQRYYEEKVEPYFGMGRFLHESFGERSTIFSLKELLERLVDRSRRLRNYDGSSMFRSIEGQPPTSHFHVPQTFDSLLSTLELNFFLTKYYVMSDRDGRRVSIYSFNYGLCEKYSIEFGRPGEHREHRLYFVERIFDYSPIVQEYIASNQEIRCRKCQKEYDSSILASLRMYNMRCPDCQEGICEVTNISRKYEQLLRNVDEESLLPATELGILQTLGSQSAGMFAGDIAGELDVSPQLVGWRGKKLYERELVERRMVKGRREFDMTTLARRIYLSDPDIDELELSDD